MTPLVGVSLVVALPTKAGLTRDSGVSWSLVTDHSIKRHTVFARFKRSTHSLIMKTAALMLLVTVLLENANVSSAFAASKKNKGMPKTAAASDRGFGAKPAEVFAEVVSQFRTRRPSDWETSAACPCSSGRLYCDCCAPYHNGLRRPETPTALLRSRYSAFCYRLIPYILETTHPTCRDWRENRISWAQDLNRAGMFDSYDFVGLESVGAEEPGKDETEVFVKFKVRLRTKERDSMDSSLQGKETVIAEKSRFLRTDDGTWLYASGDVRSDVEGLEDTVLNT